MSRNGFALIIPMVVVLIISLGYTEWLVVNARSSTRSNPTSTASVPSTARTISSGSDTSSVGKVITNNAVNTTVNVPVSSGSTCESGRIIVYFNAGVSKSRQQAIILDANATVQADYEAFNGYALNVTKGQEVAAAVSISKYAEVKSVAPEGCPDATNSPASAN